MFTRYDVVILGAGNAGMGAAGVARERGLSVAVVEDRAVGGTCPLRGCVPKKVLVAAAEAMEEIDKAARHKIAVEAPRLDWASLIEREQSFTEGVSEAFKGSLRKRGIDLYEGGARFTGRNRLRVDGEDLEAGKVVVATGSRPRPLPISGAERLITSEDLLTDRTLPDSLIFIGGGVIALEFAHVFTRAGTKVTILEVMDRLLPAADADAAEALREATEQAGIDVLTEVEVEEIAPVGERLEVRFRHRGESQALAAARVANGAGRVPDVEALDLDAAQVEHDGARIALTEHLRSVSNPNVYAAGDAVAETAQLSPLATYEGQVVGANIVEGDRHVPEYRSVPSVVFSIPPLAGVGLTEAQARERGLRFEAKATDMRGWLSARLYGAPAAYAKVLTEQDGGRILGAHLVGKRAEEVIHLFAMAIKNELGREDMAAMVYAFPTFSSDVKSMI